MAGDAARNNVWLNARDHSGNSRLLQNCYLEFPDESAYHYLLQLWPILDAHRFHRLLFTRRCGFMVIAHRQHASFTVKKIGRRSGFFLCPIRGHPGGRYRPDHFFQCGPVDPDGDAFVMCYCRVVARLHC